MARTEYNRVQWQKYYTEHKEEYRAKRRAQYAENLEKSRLRVKTSAEKRREAKREYGRRYHREHIERHAEIRRIWRHNNPIRNIQCNMRRRIAYALKKNKNTLHSMELLGCSIEEFKQYFESKFVGEMSWENYGDWHIDHIRPLCSFDFFDPEQVRSCFHYTNLQPLWAKDNLIKGSNYVISTF